MNNIGFSWYRRKEYFPLSKNRSIVVKVVFCTLTICAFLEIIRNIKDEGLKVALHKKLKWCMRFGFVMIRLFNRVCYVYLVVHCGNKVSEMLLHLRNIRKYSQDEQEYSRLGVVMGLGTIVITFTAAMLYYPELSEWSFEEAFLTRSYHLAKSLFVWTVSDYEEVRDAIVTEFYLADFTMTHAAMGVAGVFFEFCSFLQGEIIRDILVLTPLALLDGWNSFDQRIQHQLHVHPNNADPAEVESCLKQYKEMREANASANDTLGTVHKFVVMQHPFLYCFLFVLIMSYDGMLMVIIYTAIKVIKVTISSLISLKIYRKNGNAKKWLSLLTTYKGPVDVEEILGMTVQAAMENLRDDPIGFGIEYFLINEAFLVGIGAAVSSIMAMLIEAEPEKKCAEEIMFSCLANTGGTHNCTLL